MYKHYNVNGVMPVKKGSIVYRSILLAVSNVILQILGFGFRIILSRIAGAEVVGINSLTMQMYSIFHATCIGGMSVAITTLTARIYEKGGTIAVSKLIRMGISIFLGMLAFLSAILLSLRLDIAEILLGDIRTAQALWLIPICILLTGFENVYKAAYIGMGYIKKAALSEIIEQVIRYSLVVTFLQLNPDADQSTKAFLMVLGMTLSELFSVSFLGISFHMKKRREFSRRFTENPGLSDYMHIAMPSAFTSLLTNLLSSAAIVIFPMRLVVAGYSETDAVSTLGVISGMLEPMLFLPMAFIGALCTVLLPAISTHFEHYDLVSIRTKLKKAVFITLLISLLTCLITAFAPKLTLILFKQEVDMTLSVLLCVKVIINMFIAVCVSFMNGMLQQKKILVFSIIGEAVQLGLIWLLAGMPQFHIYGYVIGMATGDLLRLILTSLDLKALIKKERF